MVAYQYRRPQLAAYQLAAIFCKARIAVIEASTKSGKTHGCIVWITEGAMGDKQGQESWWVAPTLRMAKIAFGRLKRALPHHVYKTHESDVTVTLANGAVIRFLGADRPDLLFGEDVQRAVIDEGSRCKEAAWHALRTTVTHTRGPVRIIGNVKGRANWAYRLGLKAREGVENMHYARITWHDAVGAGILEQDEIDEARQQMPPLAFKELYEAEPADDAGNPFGILAIRACILEEMPKSKPVAWGWDVARAENFTVGIGLDRIGRVCGFKRMQAPWTETKRVIVELTAGAQALVDSTGVGDAVVEDLQRMSARENIRGFKFTGPSKQQLMEGLAMAIHAQEVRYPAEDANQPIVPELESFEYSYTPHGVRYAAPAGMYDDCVDSLALAVQCLRDAAQTSLSGVSLWSEKQVDPWKI